MLRLLRVALEAPDLGAGVVPTLHELIGNTAAVGAAYFQVKHGQVKHSQVKHSQVEQLQLQGSPPDLGLQTSPPLIYQVRAAAGEMPGTPGMQAIAAHGLPSDTPLLRALLSRRTPMFFGDTRLHPESAGFPELGVASLAAAPVLSARGELLGAFLMHTFELHAWSDEEMRLCSGVTGIIASLLARLAAEEQATAAREAALRALGLALEARDRETQGHTDRVTGMALQLAEHLQLGAEECQALRWGAYLHDIGKIAIADQILHKPGKLSHEEFGLMQTHVIVGHQFAGALGFLPPEALAVIAQHHERWDGAGYPQRVGGESIHLLARIFALCDVYDALISERPYKAAWTVEAARAELRAQSGLHFDPQVVQAFFGAFGEEEPAFSGPGPVVQTELYGA
ncbi:HD domain-containing phosphohydrolase [Deinococcus sp.]|uniref:HD domain-containing phosphohydrolase n=1 Tax=Deinococcus sp. TaxID=47478 RepID=UPI0025D915F5|nr:HD domain-containing phosphohydrolase [Deinococcus sp.]